MTAAGVCRGCGRTVPAVGDDGAPVTLCYRCARWAADYVYAGPFRLTVRPGMMRPEALRVLYWASCESGFAWYPGDPSWRPGLEV